MLVPKLRFKEFKDDWIKNKLGEIGVFKNGISKSEKYFGHGYKFVNLQDIFGKNEIKNGDYQLVEVSPKELDEYKLNIGDVLFVRSSVKPSGVGLTSVVTEKMIDTVYSGFIIRFREIYNILNLKFKKYCFYTDNFRKEVLKRSSSSANTNINQDNLSVLPIYYPSKIEQEKIANFLSLLDKKIELQQRKIDTLKIYKKGLIDKIYKEKLKMIKEVELKKYAYLQGGYAFKSELFSKKGIPIIRIANIVENRVNLKDIVFYDNKNSIDSKFEINIGDMLIAMSGANTGKIGIYKENIKSYLNQRVGKIVLKRKDINYSYLYFLFESSSYNIQLNSKLVAGAQPNISPSDIESLKFKIPSIELQVNIAEMVMNINKKIYIEENRIQELNKLKKGLLQKMFI